MQRLKDSVFAVIGGDKRCAYVAQQLINEQHNVKTSGLELSGIVDAAHINTLEETLCSADYIILPLPLLDKKGKLVSVYSSAKLDIYSIIQNAKHRAVLFAGRIPEPISAFSKECDKELYDYYQREELQVMNAVPTAEGTVEVLMRQLSVTISGSEILVTGFGRTALALCLLLKGMGAVVTVSARKREALAHAKSIGFRTLPLSNLSDTALLYDAIINTVPVRIITPPVLDVIRSGCYVLDIASAPGGVDVEYAAACGVETESALSLPGKVAPKTAGIIIKETVMNMIEERRCAD